jgi:hypothetical protein
MMRLLDERHNGEIASRVMERYRERAAVNVTNETLSVPPPITHIRAQRYEYQFASNRRHKMPQEEPAEGDRGDWEEGLWWRRREVGSYMPVVSLQDPSVVSYLRHYGWGE